MLTMHFQGLIVQARIDTDEGIPIDTAVLMNVPLHDPLLSVRKSDVYSVDADHVTSGDVYCFPLLNQVTTSLGSGTARALQLPGVPHLDNLRQTGGGIHRAVRGRIPHPNFAAYFELPRGSSPGGVLHTEDYFSCAVAFTLGGHAEPFGCLARTIGYSVLADDNVTITINDNNGASHNQLVVYPHADLWITNRCTDCPDEASNCSGTVQDAHSTYYKNFFDPPAAEIAGINRTGRCAQATTDPDRPRCTNPVSLDVDCANTRIP